MPSDADLRLVAQAVGCKTRMRDYPTALASPQPISWNPNPRINRKALREDDAAAVSWLLPWLQRKVVERTDATGECHVFEHWFSVALRDEGRHYALFGTTGKNQPGWRGVTSEGATFAAALFDLCLAIIKEENHA